MGVTLGFQRNQHSSTDEGVRVSTCSKFESQDKTERGCGNQQLKGIGSFHPSPYLSSRFFGARHLHERPGVDVANHAPAYAIVVALQQKPDVLHSETRGTGEGRRDKGAEGTIECGSDETDRTASVADLQAFRLTSEVRAIGVASNGDSRCAERQKIKILWGKVPIRAGA